MPAIHIIKNDPRLPQITPIRQGSDIYRSGYWAISETTAKALIGGNIFFHDKRSEPAFFGGTVTDVETVKEGDRAGRVVFTFRRDDACKGVATPREGWKQELKIVW